MEKMKMQTTNVVDENIKKIGELFPNCLTERLDENGKPELAIDFDQLRQELSKDIVEGPEERYQFTWPDKRNAIRLANAPTTDTLRPCREESVDFDNTQNLYIEGDNLEVLKLLRQNYLGKIKMIYIDPPYNTGKDFVYNDNFTQSADEYVHNSGQEDEEGNRLFTNLESNGRFHTDWLNMIYPRLKVAKDLLTEDGVIFISINDKELENLHKVCSEIFGYNNQLACFCWRTDGNFDNQARIKSCHEYILLYAKRESNVKFPDAIDPNIPPTSKIFKDEIRNTIIKNGIKNPISEVLIPSGFPCDIENFVISKAEVVWPIYDNDILIEKYKTKNDVIAKTGWASKAQLVEFINNGYNPVIDSKGQKTVFVMTKNGAIESIKKRGNTSHVISVLNNMGGAQKATTDMGELGEFFDYPKPLSLMTYLIKMYANNDDIVLDYFSGSSTTAHAVMLNNSENAKLRLRFIMVQWPELTYDGKTEKIKDKSGKEIDKYIYDLQTGYPEILNDSAAREAGFYTIPELAKERIRRAGKKIKEESPLTTQDLDIGFRVLKLDSSNMRDVFYTPEAFTEQKLFEDNIKGDRTEEDLLFQVMIELGIELSAKIEKTSIAGKTVWSVNDGYLMACFDEGVNESTIKEVAKQKPFYFVMRDSSLATDNVADNFEQIWSEYSKDTVRKIL